MELLAKNNLFVFNLPDSFVPQKFEDKYLRLLEKNHSNYSSVIDYLNSSIKSVDLPGITLEKSIQVEERGFERYYKSAKNAQNSIARAITVNFAPISNNLNYWILYDLTFNHYVDVESTHMEGFHIDIIDRYQDLLFQLKFGQIMVSSTPGKTLSYGDQVASENAFAMGFEFNTFDIEVFSDNFKPNVLGYGKPDSQIDPRTL